MALVLVHGYVSDHAHVPYAGRGGRLYFRPYRSSAFDGRLMVGNDWVRATVNDSTGYFTVQLDNSPGVFYMPVFRYLLDPEQPNSKGWDEWNLKVIPGAGGNITDLVDQELTIYTTRATEDPGDDYRGWWLKPSTGDLFSRIGADMEFVDVLLANLKGGKGDKGDQGLPGVNAVPASTAVGTYLSTVGSDAYEGAAEEFLADDAASMNGAPLWTGGDSFGQIIAPATTSWPLELANDRAMALTNKNVSSSFDRDVAVRMITDPPMLPANGYIGLNGGVNPAHNYGTDGDIRRSEKAALKAAILMAVAGSKLEHTAATFTGTWTDYANAALSGGSARTSVVPGSTYRWVPAWGDYFALAFTYRGGVGATGNSGEWKVGDSVVFPARTTAPAQTPLEVSGFADSAQNFVPWPIMAPALDGSVPVTVTAAGPGITTVDALWKIADNPPFVFVILPGYTNPAGGLHTPNATIDIYRGDRKAAVAEVIRAFPRLAGKIITVDPMLFGWDPLTDTVGDGLHPDNDGHKLIARSAQRSVGRAQIIAPLMSTWGVVSGAWPTDWPTTWPES